MRTAWRIVKPQGVASAFDGEGARLYGGRWNSKGRAVVYLAQSLSLAAMEMLVHLDSHELLAAYVCIPVEFDAGLVQTVALGSLDANWAAEPASLSTKAIADAWVAEAASALLEVPSAVIPAERNFLLNPNHPDFKKISTGPAQPFEFDPRLLKSFP